MSTRSHASTGWLARMRASLQWGTRSLWGGFALAIFLLIATATASYRSMDQFMAASASLDRIQLAVHDLNDVMSRLKDAETGERGYLVTGNESFLDPYHSSLGQVPVSVAAVRSSLESAPQSFAPVEELIGQRLALLQLGIAQKRSNATAAELQATLVQGKEVMDRIRSRIDGLIGSHEALLSDQSAELGGNAARVKHAIVMGNLLAIVLLALAFALLRSQVAERTQARRAAQVRAAEAADLFDNAPCAYHSVGNGGRLLRVNETWLKWFGYCRGEVIGRLRHQDVMTAESARRLEAQHKDPNSEFKRNGSVSDLEFEYVRKDGSTFSALVSATRIAASALSEATSRTALFDITERNRVRDETRKLHQELQQRSAQLEMTNKELESFSYSVSHDLRSPLRAIDGFTRMIEEDYQDRLDGEGKRMLGVVRQNAAQMGRLIDDLLAFSRLGRQSLSKTDIDMGRLVEEVLAGMRDGGHTHAAHIQLGELPQGYGDGLLLKQVWANLISNAVKYSARNAAPVVRISGRMEDTAEGMQCQYCVEDNGVGFDMQYYDKLFGVFQRLHAASDFPGTGVGLAIVQRVVTRHGGRVWAEARVDQGAKFFFTLPTGGAGDA